MTGSVRAASLRGFGDSVHALGGDPVAKLVRLLKDAARTLGVPDLGLRLAQAQDINVLGLVAVVIQNSPTVGAANAS